jgi:hypothetical protein
MIADGVPAVLSRRERDDLQPSPRVKLGAPVPQVEGEQPTALRVLVDQHQREAVIGAANSVRGDQRMTKGVCRCGVSGQHGVQAIPGLHPLAGEHARRPERGHRLDDATGIVRQPEDQVAPAVAVELVDQRIGLEAVQVGRAAAVGQEGTDRIGVEQRSRHLDHVAAGKGGKAVLGDEHRHLRRQSLGVLGVDDIGEKLRRPGQLRRRRQAPLVERVPLKGEEREVSPGLQAAELLQEAPGPRHVATRAEGPAHPIRDRGLIARPAELQAGVDPVQAAGELHVQRAIVLRRDELSVRLLAQLHAAHRHMERPQVTQLGRGVVRGAVKRGHGRQQRGPVHQPAVQHGLKARLLRVRVAVARAVPRVGRGHVGDGLTGSAPSVTDNITQAVALKRPHIQFAHRKAEPVADIGRPGQHRVGTAVHEDSHVAHPAGRRLHAERLYPAASAEQRAVKGQPVATRIVGELQRIPAHEVLDPQAPRVRLRPGDPNGIDRGQPAKVNEHPLRMDGIGLVGEMRIEIRIALPERPRAAVVQARVAVVVGLIDRVAPTR